MQKTFCNIEALKKNFLDDRVSLKYMGYFQVMISLLNTKVDNIILAGCISVKEMAQSLNVHEDTIRRFFEYCEEKNIIIQRYKEKYLDDKYQITINPKYLNSFLVIKNSNLYL